MKEMLFLNVFFFRQNSEVMKILVFSHKTVQLLKYIFKIFLLFCRQNSETILIFADKTVKLWIFFIIFQTKQ